MKNLITLIAIVAIAFTSCTSSKNGIVMKRKYSKGFYVAHNHKKNNVEVNKNIKTSEDVVVTEKENIEKLSPVKVKLSDEVSINELKKSSVIEKKETVEMKHNTIFSDSKNITASVKKGLKVAHTKIDVVKSTKSKGGSDTELILLVILCFFPILSLVAMYLHDGKKITLNFWINLLLYLTFVLWVVFGILVVLDIIDLS
jgi:hypothetical protein